MTQQPEMRLVPVEPTETMMNAGIAKLMHGGVHLGLKNAYRAMIAAAPQPDHGVGALAWAVSRWKAEVENRPVQNQHRRSLDDVWRQVIRYHGGDPDTLLTLPDHDSLAALKASEKGNG